jgi:hypothetical protein
MKMGLDEWVASNPIFVLNRRLPKGSRDIKIALDEY